MKFKINAGYLVKGEPVYQYLAVFSGSISIISTGMHYGWPSPSLPKLLSGDHAIVMTNDQSSWVVVASLFGTFAGSYIGAALLDRIGRKNVILLTAIPYFISWMMIAFADSVLTLIIARFISGLPDGLVHCAFPMYYSEITNPSIRGFASAFISVSMVLGMLLCNVIGSYFSIETTALLSSVVPVLLVVIFCWMPESPYYLIMREEMDKARESLQILKGMENVDQELNRLTKVVQEQNCNRKSCLDVLTERDYRRAVFIGLLIRIAQQFGGVNAITFYAQTIFKEAGNGISPVVASTSYFVIYMLILIFASMLVDKIGRKPLMVLSVIGSGIALAIMGSYFYIIEATNINMSALTWVPMFALILYIVTFGIGMQPIPTILIGELFPTNIKAIALTLCSNSYSVGTATAAKFFQFTKDTFGIHVPFFAFSISCFLSLIFIVLFVPETKGKTLEEIQEVLKGKRVKKNRDVESMERFSQIKNI